jgi:hypothetical protein
MPQVAHVILFGRLDDLLKAEKCFVGSSHERATKCWKPDVAFERNGLDAAAAARLLQACIDGPCQWREATAGVHHDLTNHANRGEWAVAIWLDEENGQSICGACIPAELREFALFDDLLDEAQQAGFRAFALKQAARLAKENPYW